MPEPDASFDFAFANSVLEHIPDLQPCLAETAAEAGRIFFRDGPLARDAPVDARSGPVAKAIARGLPSRDRSPTRTLSLSDGRRVDGPANDARFRVSQRSRISFRTTSAALGDVDQLDRQLYRLKGAKDRPIEIQRIARPAPHTATSALPQSAAGLDDRRRCNRRRRHKPVRRGMLTAGGPATGLNGRRRSSEISNAVLPLIRL